jgi:hypothetical protein
MKNDGENESVREYLAESDNIRGLSFDGRVIWGLSGLSLGFSVLESAKQARYQSWAARGK